MVASVALVLALGTTVVAQSAPEAPLTAGLPRQSDRLQEGDLVEVEVFDTPQLSSTLRVSADGQLYLPIVGSLAVIGMTARESAAAIEERLRKSRIMLRPHVGVRVLEYGTRSVSVLGEVNRPGNYGVSHQQSLAETLAAAGGVTTYHGDTVTVTRRDESLETINIGTGSKESWDRQRRTAIRNGDMIVVSRAASIYVIGDVGRPGEFPLAAGAKFGTLNAVALAGGLNRTAAGKKALIIRQTSEGPKTLPIDLSRVAANKMPDQSLQPNDVLVVPRSGSRSFTDFALPGAMSAMLASVAAALVVR